MMNEDLPNDLAHPRPDGRAGMIAGVVVGLALLGLTASLLLYALIVGI